MRFTNTWSPISSVFSIELDGISNACTTKVMMKSPVTRTAASEARNSTVVSLCFSSGALLASSSFFGNVVFVPISNFWKSGLRGRTHSQNKRIQLSATSVYQPERSVPARDLEDVRHGVGEVMKPTLKRILRIAIPIAHGPVNDQRASDDVFARNESPIAAVLAIVAVISHYEVIALWHDQLAVFY